MVNGRVIKAVYQALLRPHSRLINAVNNNDVSKLVNTTRDIEELCEKYPWLPQLGVHYWIQRVLKRWKVLFTYGTYTSEGEVNFSATETWNLMKDPEDAHLDDKSKSFKRQMINFMLALNWMKGCGRLMPDKIQTVLEIMMRGEKSGKPVLTGKYRTTNAVYHEFAPVSAIPRLVTDALDRYYSTETDDPIWNAVRLFIDLINIHPFEDGNGSLCRLVISPVLVEGGLSLFSVLLSSFHKRDRRHYIQVVKRFEERPSLLDTMVCKSLVKVWDNFEQNLALLEN
ncbi:protein adenylyltransferase fic-1-like [Hydractinia symbiolongicarpus]|uniref:protein adenylyltransferase fic-1-like n=1 Tax=Hydractinia symbiolongicarpus TaxID=13093 RepID=UPI002549E634|nr:protein adenylyltransferase fic-1-like [Hydractinia symbiolongicarpus]